MNMTDLQQKVNSILIHICKTDAPAQNPELDLFANGLLDSFGVVELLIEVENQLGLSVAITDFDRETWRTPRQIASQLEALQ